MPSWTIRIYLSAALVNTAGVLVFSRGLTSDALSQPDPSRFGTFGLVMIMIWGLCYAACARPACRVPEISVVFALEKLAYVVSWLTFLRGPVDWTALYAADPLAGLFYSIYGVVDASYLVLFLWCARTAHRTKMVTLDHRDDESAQRSG